MLSYNHVCECYNCTPTCLLYNEWGKCYARDTVKKKPSEKCIEGCNNTKCDKNGRYKEVRLAYPV